MVVGVRTVESAIVKPVGADHVTMVEDMANSLNFWLWVWLGTTTAGGVFVLLLCGRVDPFEGAVIGLMAGTVYAGVWAALIVGALGGLTWAAWITRFRIALALVGGEMTGIAAVLYLLYLSTPSPGRLSLVAIAGMIGAAGGGLAAMIHDMKIAPRTKHSSPDSRIVWQFTRRDLFVRMAVLAMMLAVWIWIIDFLQGGVKAFLLGGGM